MNDLCRNEVAFEMSNCAHENITKTGEFYFCVKCGSLQCEDGSVVLKSKISSFPGKINGIQNLKCAWSRHFAKPELPESFIKV